MKAYEAAKKLGIEPKEFAEQYGLKSHLSKVPAHIEKELFGDEKKIVEEQAPAQTVDSAETVVVGKPVDCPVDLETLATSLRGAGGKSPYWEWRHLLNA